MKQIAENVAFIQSRIAAAARKSGRNPSDPQSTYQLIETAEVMGVYRVNNGIADFRKVIIGDVPHTLGYYILEPGLNKGLQEKDSIVYDASEVTDGQIIF